MIKKLSLDTAVKMGSIAHSVWRDGGTDPDYDGPRNGHHQRKIYEYDEAKVCLTCPRKHCDGGEACFSARRRQMKRKEES